MTTPHFDDENLLATVAAAIRLRAATRAEFEQQFARVVRSAVDYVVDPVRTARTRLSELDNVEKTFIGLKVEHFVRDWLDVPRGKRDLVIAGVDVDVKNTTRSNWMIPKETYTEKGVCLLVKIDDERALSWLGLFVARPEYLGQPNRDLKRSLNVLGRKNVRWLIESLPVGASVWDGFDMNRFRELRRIRGGTARAAKFFTENVGRTVPREIIESLLFDQLDPMKRLRGNGGARDVLEPMGIMLVELAEGSWRADLAHGR